MELKSLEVSKENELYKRFTLDIYEQDMNLEYAFKIVTERENIHANDWEKEANMKFPIEILKIEIDNIIYKDGTIKDEKLELVQNNSLGISFEKKITNVSKIWYGFKLDIMDKGITNINGRIFYKSLDSNIEVNIEREKVSGNE